MTCKKYRVYSFLDTVNKEFKMNSYFMRSLLISLLCVYFPAIGNCYDKLPSKDGTIKDGTSDSSRVRPVNEVKNQELTGTAEIVAQ